MSNNQEEELINKLQAVVNIITSELNTSLVKSKGIIVLSTVSTLKLHPNALSHISRNVG